MWALATEGMTHEERALLEAEWADPEPSAPVPVKSRADAIAEWGTSPEAEAGLRAAIADQGGMVTA